MPGFHVNAVSRSSWHLLFLRGDPEKLGVVDPPDGGTGSDGRHW